MKILGVNTLQIEAVKVIRFGRFCDHRGYFTEHYRKSDFTRSHPKTSKDAIYGTEKANNWGFGIGSSHPEVNFAEDVVFVQANESYSKKGTVRGLHFQWNPYMGKLVRTLSGRMVDMVLDIRKGSPTFGKIILYDMPADSNADYCEWIWVPPGFAHGNFFTEDTMIEYFCSGEYNPGCEAGISPLAEDIDWALCDPKLKKLFGGIAPSTEMITDKDKNGFTIAGWLENGNSDNFVYGRL